MALVRECFVDEGDDENGDYENEIELNYDEEVISVINSNYNKLVRPNRQVSISLRMSLMQLVSLDEK
jgi:hypothetical protein